jgi:glycosyltransferase involved in cell wall biosynthesis
LNQEPSIEAELLFSRHQNSYLHAHSAGQALSPIAAKIYAKAMTKSNLGIALTSHADIHHSTYYLGFPKKAKGETKLVSTLHDMVPELFPDYFKSNPHINKLKWFETSDLIISVSDSSAADLAYFRPELASRICRIHLYSGFTDASPQSKPSAIDHESRPYILFVGKRGAYKNGSMLRRAFAASKPKSHGYKLLFAGGGALNRVELADIERLRITNFVQQVNVSDAELWYLYHHATAVLVPSMAEGFSLPLVEGLAANVPVVCSDIPVHREVAGDFAEKVNALEHQDWADIFGSIHSLKRPSEKLGLQLFGERCKYFSKERMVEEHIKAYESV